MKPAIRLLAALGPVALAGCATEPSATWREQAQTTNVGDTSTRALTTLVELGVQQSLGPGFEYRASDRFIQTALETTVDGDTRRDDRWLHQPSLDLVVETPTIRWTQDFELLQNKSQPSGGPDNQLDRTDLLEKLEWTPVDLPRFTGWFNRRTDKDDLFVDRDDNKYFFQVDDDVGPFSWLYSLDLENENDNAADVQRDLTTHLVRASYREDHLDGDLTTSAYFSDQRRELKTDSSSGSSGALPSVEVFPVQGLSVVDTTPALGMLGDTPALIDGDDTTLTPINIGGFVSGGQTDWNIGIKLPPASTVNLAVVSTSTVVDPLLVGQYSFSVWSSPDGNFWTQVTGSASWVYEEAFRRFRISFPAVTTMYLKVVDTAAPPTAPAVFVTEMRAFAPSPDGPGNLSTKQNDEDRSLSGSVSWRATDTVVLGADVLAQDSTRDLAGTTLRDETRLDTGVNGTWTPTPEMDLGVRANQQDINDKVLADERYRLLTALWNLRPLERLDLGVNWTTTDRNSDAGTNDLKTDSVQFRAAAQLLEALQAQVTAEKAKDDDISNDRVIDRTILTASATADVTSDWNVTLSARDESDTVTGSGSEGIPDPSSTSYQTIVVYQPGDQFTVEANLEWQDTFAGSGLDQQLTIDWLPFRDGSLDVQVDLQRQVNGTFNETIDRYLFLTRWNMNVHAYIEFNWSAQIPDSGDRVDVVTLSLNVEW